MRRRLGRLFAIVTGIAATVMLAAPATTQETGLAKVQMPIGGAVDVADAPSLSVLTYNVEGLPWPVRFGRADAARQIAERLRALRSAGQQPHVVVLQEAFTDAQRAIGRAAGYRYVTYGPDRDLPGAEPTTDAERAFASRGAFFRGEKSGKWLGSGIVIMSDYPIVDVKRAAFPAYACAGFDCLANKGVAMAMIQVPGAPQPVAVIATHLNSKAASGVSKARFTFAFERQVDTIGAFLKANLPADAPYVLAGDTNIGKSADRMAYFDAMLAGARAGQDLGGIRTALGTCFDPATACPVPSNADAAKSWQRRKDLQVYAAGQGVALEPVAISVPFGHESDGGMLSDHVGYTATYRLTVALAATPAAHHA